MSQGGHLVHVPFEGSASSLIGGACPHSPVFRLLLVTGVGDANMGHATSSTMLWDFWLELSPHRERPVLVSFCTVLELHDGMDSESCVVGS